MMSEENKAIYLRILKDFFEGGDAAVIDELYDDKHVNHFMGINGAEAWKQFMVPWRTAYPDVHFELHFQMADGDKVLNSWTAHGTHTGELMGIPATGKKTSFSGISIARIKDGKVIEEWSVMDMFSLMQQLGVIPAMGETVG
jgi:steroid delta-isomerase-like uncharacterized protein